MCGRTAERNFGTADSFGAVTAGTVTAYQLVNTLANLQAINSFDLSNNYALGRDIDAAYYAFDADYRFFRLDLKGAPEMGSNNYAPLYQFAIGTPGGTGYLNTLAMPISFPPPTTLSFFSGAAPPSMFSEFHFRFKTPSVLEWAVKKEDLPDYFAWYALTGDLSGGSISGIFDMTAPALATPIPSAAWLLGSGVIALIGLRRRKVTGYSFS